VAAGDIVVLDLGQANVMTAASSTSLTLTVPRSTLDRLCPGVESLHGTYPGAASAARACRITRSRPPPPRLGSGLCLRLQKRRAFQPRFSQAVWMLAARSNGYRERVGLETRVRLFVRRGLAAQN